MPGVLNKSWIILDFVYIIYLPLFYLYKCIQLLWKQENSQTHKLMNNLVSNSQKPC